MISLNINILDESQLLILASSIFMIIEGLPVHSHIRDEYQLSFNEIENLYYSKTGEKFKIHDIQSIDSRTTASQFDIIEKFYNP